MRRREGLVTEPDAAAVIRKTLERGALSAVAPLGKTDGFLGNPRARIAARF